MPQIIATANPWTVAAVTGHRVGCPITGRGGGRDRVEQRRDLFRNQPFMSRTPPCDQILISIVDDVSLPLAGPAI